MPTAIFGRHKPGARIRLYDIAECCSANGGLCDELLGTTSKNIQPSIGNPPAEDTRQSLEKPSAHPPG
jgi:hypothetical protein